MTSVGVITVSHGDELKMLKLQARSLRLFLAPDFVDTIVVVNNDNDQAGFRENFNARVLPEYGHLSARVRLVDRSDLMEGFEYVHGWRTQQALKMIAVSRSEHDYSIVLDSKNHFVRPVTERSYQAADGRLISCFCPQRGHLEPLFKNSFAYFGVDAEEFIDRALPNVTPIPLRTSTVRDMLAAIEAREHRTFAEFFLTGNSRFAEFYLLAAYIAARDHRFETEYELTTPKYVTVFQSAADVGSFKAIMYRLGQESTLAFAIHWAARPLLDNELRNSIAKVWIERGLVQDRHSAEEFF